jgi:hypothetical protein
MLQPGDLFATLPKVDIPQLVRVKNDEFWEIPIKKYSEILKDKIQKSKEIPNKSKPYLKGLIDFMDENIKSSDLKELYTSSGKEIKTTDIIKNFGELLGPYFAIKFLKGRKIVNIVFPVRQNYEVFDFFIKNEHHYGFSSKAASGGTNTLAPKLVVERLDNMSSDSEFKNYQKEIIVLRTLTNHGMYEGIVLAFGELIKNPLTKSKMDKKILTAKEMSEMFKGVNFEADSMKFEKNKPKEITEINLSKPEAYRNFLNEFILESTQKVSEADKKAFLSGKKAYTSMNVVYGLTKFIASTDFDFDYVINAAFQDLNIVKMSMNKDGIPAFKMVATVDAEDTVKGGNYVFRNKASFSRINDKLGLQL